MGALLVTNPTFDGATLNCFNHYLGAHIYGVSQRKIPRKWLITLPKVPVLHTLALLTLNAINLLQTMLSKFKIKLIAHGVRAHDQETSHNTSKSQDQDTR